jgi:hypothetical protein
MNEFRRFANCGEQSAGAAKADSRVVFPASGSPRPHDVVRPQRRRTDQLPGKRDPHSDALPFICLEGTGSDGEPPDSLTTRQLAVRVLELYWPHALPFGGHGTLRQGGVRYDQQAEIVYRIARFRTRWASAHAATTHRAHIEQPQAFSRLVDFVEWKLVEMPIPRLQVLGREEDRFLYEYHWDQGIRHSVVAAYQCGEPGTFDNRLLLKPGVSLHLVRLNSVLRPLFRREWALMVAGMNQLPQAELERFLFGVERVALDNVRGPLLDLQGDRCFYCDRRIAFSRPAAYLCSKLAISVWLRQPLRQRPLPDRLEVLGRQPNVQPPVLPERGLRVTGVPGTLPLAAAGGLPFAAFDRLEQLLLVGIKLHRRTPHPDTASSRAIRDSHTPARVPL